MGDQFGVVRIPGFYKLPLEARLEEIKARSGLSDDDLKPFSPEGGLSLEEADHMIENVIGLHALPVGIALNFMVNGRDVFVPMVVEEPSVVAGASFMAKLTRFGGGFMAQSTPPQMIGQIQVLDLNDVEEANLKILNQKENLLFEVQHIDPVLERLGGGAQGI